ncbi:protein kinase domain-containing protein [Risungbinella massiliensis]|uniref:protein kinase domain-containing protein n=1 Tax=Risungbinella massiliensis TaxID=1329796 RepID=UPI0005CBBF55|nr:protein kinase [Risungbinella massiliensis]
MNFQLRNNRYQLLQLLADEELTHLYLAKDTETDEEVIVEILQPRYAVQKAIREQFLLNGEMLQSLQIPNIVKPIYLESSKTICYQVWSKCSAISLEEYIGLNQVLSREESLQVAYEITFLLEALHNQGLTHGNLCSASIYYTPTQPVELKVPMALSKEEQAGLNILSYKKQAPFAVHYQSPEQLRGEKGTVQSDLYALGVILYRAVSGSFPNQEPNGGHPKNLTKDNKLLALLTKLLDERPSKRFQSAKAARRAISKLMGKERKLPIKLPWIIGGAISAAVLIASIPLIGLADQEEIDRVPIVEKSGTGSNSNQSKNPSLQGEDSMNPSEGPSPDASKSKQIVPKPVQTKPTKPSTNSKPSLPDTLPKPTDPPPIDPKPPTNPPPDPERPKFCFFFCSKQTKSLSDMLNMSERLSL